jgi:metallo-beta-lactamase family protein
VHTIGGLSAHADQQDLLHWYGGFSNRPPVYLVHGEEKAQRVLFQQLQQRLKAPAVIPELGQQIEV